MENSIVASEPQSFIRYFKKSFVLSFYAFKKTLLLSVIGSILLTANTIIFAQPALSYIKTFSGEDFWADIVFSMQHYWLKILMYLAFSAVNLIFTMIYITQINSRLCNNKLSVTASFLIAKKNFFSYLSIVVITLVGSFLLIIKSFWESSIALSVIYWILTLLLPFILIFCLFMQYSILLEGKKIFEAFFTTLHLGLARYWFRILMVLILIGSIAFINKFSNDFGVSDMFSFFIMQMLSLPLYTSFFLNMFYDLKLRKLMQKTDEKKGMRGGEPSSNTI